MKKRFRKLAIILATALVFTTTPVNIMADTVSEDSAETYSDANEEVAAETAADPELPEAPEGSTEEKGSEDNNSDENNSEESAPEDGESEKKNDSGKESAASENGTSETEEGENPEDVNAEETETVSDNLTTGPDVSNNEIPEDTLSDNEAVSDNEIEDEESVSENTVSEDQFNFGTIDMTMEFDADNVAAIAEATAERKEQIVNAAKKAGIAGVDATNALGTDYFDASCVTAPRDVESKWDWAYAAANLVESSMIKNKIKKEDPDPNDPEKTEKMEAITKDDLEAHPIDVSQIVGATYYKYRHDLNGETWFRYSNSSVYDESITTNKQADYTVFDADQDLSNLKNVSGNLVNTVFDFERWGSPSYSDVYKGYEGNVGQIDAQMENAVWVPNTDIESIKTLIQDYGAAAVQVSVNSVNSFNEMDTPEKGSVKYNPGGKKYVFKKYARYTNDYKANHTVVLVGWDDNIETVNFKSDRNPTKKGGFLAKDALNGVAQNGGGYFWISYDDVAFQKTEGTKFRYALALDFTHRTTSDYNYGYDGTNHYDTFETKKVYGIFKAGHSEYTSSGKVEILKSVGVGVQEAGRYVLTIYYGYDPSASKQYLNQYEVETKTFDIDYPGFHTVELPEPIIFYKNDVISVCLEREDAGLFNMLIDGFADRYDDGKLRGTKIRKDGNVWDALHEYSQVLENGIRYNAYTHSGRDRVESYFSVAANGGTILSGNKVPVPGGTSSDYMMITPRMRLYTSDVKMPQDVDQTMLEIKLKKYIWLYTGKNVNPFPEVIVNFAATEDGPVSDRGGRVYNQALVMYNHYNLSYANHKEVGLGAVIARGKGDVFSGEISVPFKIVKEQVRIDSCKFMGLEPQDFRETKGKTLNSTYGRIKDKVIVKYYVAETKHYITLTEGIDYKIGSIEGDNVMGKKLSLMITGIGTFKNTAKPKFKLRKAKEVKPISDATLSVNLAYEVNGIRKVWKEGELPELKYTGKKINMEIDSIYEYDPETGESVLLQPGVDYDDTKIKYKNSKNCGMASIIVKAKKGGRFSGKLTRYYMIMPKHATTDATVKFKSNYKYTGKPIKAKPTVKLYGKTLPAKDIYVLYYNNTGSSSGSATATGIVFGKGRLTGYIGYSTFTIKPSSSSSSSSSK